MSGSTRTIRPRSCSLMKAKDIRETMGATTHEGSCGRMLISTQTPQHFAQALSVPSGCPPNLLSLATECSCAPSEVIWPVVEATVLWRRCSIVTHDPHPVPNVRTRASKPMSMFRARTIAASIAKIRRSYEIDARRSHPLAIWTEQLGCSKPTDCSEPSHDLGRLASARDLRLALNRLLHALFPSYCPRVGWVRTAPS